MILDDIEKIAAKFSQYRTGPEELGVFHTWREAAKKGLLIGNLAEHEGIKMLIKEINDEIFEMDMLLLNSDSKTIPDEQRDRLIDRKKLYVWFRSFFTDAAKGLMQVENEVAENMKANNVNK